MSYLPFARRYRPQSLEDLVGQSHVTTTLARALEGKRVAQAYLFAGMRGVGKTSAARILAKCLNCERGPTATPCNQCATCTQITQGNSLDVLEIDGASNRGIEEIRNLRQAVPFAPTSGPFRVYIIDEVHMLTAEAFNALLKTLEEPPAHVKFIFATTAANKVPPTILSRCQRFDFRRIEPAAIVDVLTGIAKAEGVRIDEPALFAIARASEGSLRDAEVVLEQAASFVQGPIDETQITELLGAVESEALMAWTQAILERDTPKALAVLMSQRERGKDPAQLLTGLLRQVRNLLIVSSLQDEASRDATLTRLIDEPAERLARLAEQARRSTPQELLVILQVLTGVYELVRRSPMAQTVLELVVIKLCTREQWQSLGEIASRLERLNVPPVATPAAEPQAAPAPDAPPVDASVASPMGTAPEALTSLWPAFLERLGAQKMSLAAYLAEAKPLSLNGEVFTVGLPSFALHQEVLSLTENRRLISRLLGELVRGPVTVQYATLPESSEPTQEASAPSEAAPAVPPVVQDIVRLFNATILDRPPKPT